MRENNQGLITIVTNVGEEVSLLEEEAAKAFAVAIKELRKYLRYTLKQVENGTGINFQSIARYEKGENIPSLTHALRIAEFYKIDIYNILLAGISDEETREEIFETAIVR